MWRHVINFRLIRSAVFSWLLLSLFSAALPESSGDEQRDNRRLSQFHERRRQLLGSLRRDLSALSEKCHLDGQGDLATDITAVSLDLTAPESGQSLPRLVQLPVSDRLPDYERIVRNRIAVLRGEKAKELYILARAALREAQLPSMAYLLIHDVLRLDPDHKHSRAVLGQQMFRDPARREDKTYAGEWVSPFEASRRIGNTPDVNHETFGWIPAAHVPRYEEGLRPWGGRWIVKEKEAELRRNFRNAWEIRTEHFLVKTNTSLEEGVQLSRRLETYYGWLHTNFAAFFDTPQDLRRRFEQAQSVSRRTFPQRPMQVHYYANREEYQERTRGKIPPNIVTNGLYWEPDRTCYLFRNPEDPETSTAFHEATHQIFDWVTRDHRVTAARKLLRQRGQRSGEWVLCRNSNFWVLEGIACYMESFQIIDGQPVVGDPKNIRFMGATRRLLADNFYIDMRTFSSLGKETFRRHPNHTQLYTQGSGVAHFLLHYKGGLYRDAFIALLSGVYQPDMANLTVDPSLEKLTGVPFDVLDLQYREHITELSTRQ